MKITPLSLLCSPFVSSLHRTGFRKLSSPRHPIQSIYENASLLDALNNGSSIQNELPFKYCLGAMNDLKLADFSLSTPYLEQLQSPECMEIFSSSSFSMAIFLLPAGYCIPLHDHPNMYVCTKIVHGEVRVRSFNAHEARVPHPAGNPTVGSSENGSLRKALDFRVPIRTVEELSKNAQSESFFLTPGSSNFHEIKANTTCVMFDLFFPPYDESNGRSCNYYELQHERGNATGIGGVTDKFSFLKKLTPLECARTKLLHHLPSSVLYRGFRPRRWKD
jgi:hypothetical protein